MKRKKVIIWSFIGVFALPVLHVVAFLFFVLWSILFHSPDMKITNIEIQPFMSDRKNAPNSETQECEKFVVFYVGVDYANSTDVARKSFRLTFFPPTMQKNQNIGNGIW